MGVDAVRNAIELGEESVLNPKNDFRYPNICSSFKLSVVFSFVTRSHGLRFRQMVMCVADGRLDVPAYIEYPGQRELHNLEEAALPRSAW